jgi:NAD+ kinase
MEPFLRVAVAYHPQVEKAVHEAGEVTSFIADLGYEVSCAALYDPLLRQQITDRRFDFLIALGGDGSMLRAGHLCGPIGIPILGINMGRFGFLTEINVGDWRQMLPRLFAGDYWLENRMMLLSQHWREEQCLGSWDVLNEVFVGRGASVQPVHLITKVDGRHLTTYVADGLLASTPTGSTAYALAAGGPILPPELRNILLVPIAPHLSVDRAIVLAEGSAVNITIQADDQAVLSIDGQASIELANGDQVEARASEHSVHFIRFQDPGYFYRNLTPHMSQNPITGNNR